MVIENIIISSDKVGHSCETSGGATLRYKTKVRASRHHSSHSARQKQRQLLPLITHLRADSDPPSKSLRAARASSWADAVRSRDY